MSNTEYFSFSFISALSDLLNSYNGDLASIDRILNVLGSPSDGSTVTVDEPISAPSFDVTLGGDLSPGITYYYTYTFTDPATGLESVAAPQGSAVIPDDLFPPDAPVLTPAATGGSLSPGLYSYVLSGYVGSSIDESAAYERAETTLPVAYGSTQKITLTLPALGDFDGFNIYRRRPGMTGYYFIASTTGSSFVDSGYGPEDCERFAPVDSSFLSGYSNEIFVGGATPFLPSGYHWNIYRTTTSGEYENKFLITITDGSMSYVDDGSDVSYGTPPLTTPVLIPGNVGLRSGAVDPTDDDGNDGDWWINTVDGTLFGPKALGEWPLGSILLGSSDIDGGEW